MQYARVGCPVSVGRDWNPDVMGAAVTKVPHSSALEDDAISIIQVEAREKSAQGFTTSRTANPQFQALNLRHKSDVHS